MVIKFGKEANVLLVLELFLSKQFNYQLHDNS